MITYLIMDKDSGLIASKMEWAEPMKNEPDIVFPKDWVYENDNQIAILTTLKDVWCGDVYDFKTGLCVILDDTEDKDIELTNTIKELEDYEAILSDFQEVTWSGLGMITTNLPQEWQDKINTKNALKAKVLALQSKV
ncbi:hypothetical protein [Clostridium sp.]|uniref:hypothetical protein n=1 Tax=Clostridium sp. TaxID=1506 RepID=UPI00260486E6|nr:hypothetical protein [uncultured Clostridium sp.]